MIFKKCRKNPRHKTWFKNICRIVLVTFTINTMFLDLARLKTSEAQAVLNITPPGTLIMPSHVFVPPLLQSIAIDPTDPFKLDFIMSASSDADMTEDVIKRLTQYFLTFLAVPEEDLWVNLSPYESNRIINDTLEQTIVGRDMLLSDYFLKQLAASMTYPERSLGKTFWETLKKRIQEKYNLSELPVNSLNKIWVVPDKAVLHENGSSAYIHESRLKVMLEEDYLESYGSPHSDKFINSPNHTTVQDYRTLYREIIIPEIEKEVNEGAHFAQLRQIYHSLILAIWFKQKLKQHVVNTIYSDQKKISGIDLSENNIGNKIYAKYIESIQKGAYDYIKEDYDPIKQSILSQHYFSGGFSFNNWSQWFHTKVSPVLTPNLNNFSKRLGDNLASFSAKLIPKGVSRKTLALTLAAVGCSSIGCSTTSKRAGSASWSNPAQSPPEYTQQAKFQNIQTKGHEEEAEFFKADIKTFATLTNDETSQSETKNLSAQNNPVNPDSEENKTNLPPPSVEDLKEKTFDITTDLSNTPPDSEPPSITEPKTNAVSTSHASTDVPSEKSVSATMETIQQNSVAIPLESSLHAPTDGYIVDFDETKTAYKKGAFIFSVEPPEALEELEVLKKELLHRERILDELEQLASKGAATSVEINKAQTDIDLVRLKIKKLNASQPVHRVHAPFDMQIINTFMSNGTATQKDTKLIDYFNTRRTVVTVQAPPHINHIHNLENFLIDGQPVNNVISAEWHLDPHHNEANISFVVEANQPITASKPMNVTISIPGTNTNSDASDHTYPTTVAQVHHHITQPVTSPLEGSIRYYVEEGDRVEVGQLLAEIEPTPYWQYFHQLLFTYNSIQRQLNQIYTTPQNIQIFTQEDIIYLETQKDSIWQQIKTAQKELQELQILAPTDGIVDHINTTHSNQFNQGDTILTLKNGQVVIGDTHNSRTAILLSDKLSLNPDDPVLVRTTQGIEIPAKIIMINRNPIDDNTPLQGLQAVQIIAEDTDYVMGKNMPVKIIIPTDAEIQTIIRNKLIHIAQTREDAKRKTPTQPNILKLLRFNEPENTSSDAHRTLTSYQHPVTFSPIAGTPLNLKQLTKAIANNNLLTGHPRLEVLQKQVSEQLSRRSLLNLNGGIYFTENNQLAFSGGITGVLEGLTAQASTGNAISASLPLVLQLSGNIIHKISGKEQKQEELAMQMTRIAQHHMEAEVLNIITDTTSTYIALAEAQRHLEHLKTVKTDLLESMVVLQQRLSKKLITSTPIDTLQQTIDEIEQKIEDWQLQINQFNHVLRAQIGTVVSENTPSFAPVLPWNGTFTDLTPEQEHRLISNLTGQHSRNYRVKEALAAVTAMQQTIKLQNIGFLPSVDLHSVFISDIGEPDFNPFYNLVSGAVLRTSRMGEGGNAGIKWTLPLFDSERKAQTSIAQIERTKVALNLSKVKTDVRNSLMRVASKIRTLKQQIESATQTYQQRQKTFRTKTDTGLHSAEQLITDRLALAEAQERIINLKAQYFLAETKLRQLQVLGLNESLVNSKTTVESMRPITRSATGGPPPDDDNQKTGNLLLIPETINAVAALTSENSDESQEKTYRVARVEFTQAAGTNKNTANLLWTIMQTDAAQDFSPRLSTIRTSLLEEANIYTRTNSINYFLTELAEEEGFLETLEYIILNTPYLDVAEQLFDFMAKKENRDVRFFIHIANRALKEKNDRIAHMGFQTLNDIIIEDPGLFDRFSEINLTLKNNSPSGQYFNDISLNSARNVLTTFLLWIPKDSIAITTLLRAKYWNTSRLADIHNNLKPLGKNKQIKELQHIIKDEILRRRLVENVPDFFNLGPFNSVQSDLIPFDFLNKFTLRHLSQANMEFLETSPDWRAAHKYITPELFTLAMKSVDKTLVQTPSSKSDSIIPNLDFIANATTSAPNTAYFASLSLNQQKRFIQENASITQLSHILSEQPQLRGLTLNRLMQTRKGRLLALKVYSHSEDPQLDRLVEEQPWHDPLKEDISTTRHPGEYSTYRQSLEKLHHNTQEEWPLDLRLATFQYLDAYGATDPRGDAYVNSRVNLLATDLSLRYHEQKADFKPRMFSRRPVLSADQHELITTMRHIINTTSNPQTLEQFLEERLHQNAPSTHTLLSKIVADRNQFSHRVRNNDQHTSWMPLSKSIGILLTLFGGIIMPVWLWRKYRKIKNLTYQEKISHLGKVFQIEIFNNDKERKNTRVAHRPPHKGALINIPDSLQNYKNIENLKHWHKLISKWDIDTTKPDEIINDLYPIINDAMTVLRNIPFTPKLIWDEDGADSELNEEYSKKLSYLYILAERTLNRIHHILHENADLTELQNTELSQNLDIMIALMKHVTRYKRIIEYRQIFDKIMGYKLPEEHWAERSKIYPLARWVLLYTRQINMAVGGIADELPLLLAQGNELIANLYPDPEDITEKSIALINQVYKRGAQLTAHGSSSMRTEYKMRSFRGRILLVGFPLGGIIMVTLGGLLGISGLVTFGLSFLGLLSLSLAVGNYWLPHIDIMQITWNKIMTHVNDALEQRLQIDLNKNTNKASTDKILNVPSKDEIINLAINQGVEALRSELDSAQPPQVDMIVIIPENAEEESINQLRNYVKSRRGSIIRHDVPVEIPSLAQQYNGSANAYIEALSYIRKKLSSDKYRNHFAHLQCDANGVCRDPKVMFVFHGNNNNQHAAVLDWSITNGYRVSHNTKTHKTQKQHHVLLYTRDAYFGPIKQFAGENITVLANWVSEDNLRNLGLLHLENNGTSPHVREIYEKIHVPNLLEAAQKRILPSKLYYFLARKFNIHNRELLQYPAFYGMVVFNDKTVRILNNVVERLDADAELRSSFEYLHLTLDLISILMKGKSDVHDTFLPKRVTFQDVIKHFENHENGPNLVKLYRRFYKIVLEEREKIQGHKLEVAAHLPHPGVTELIRVDDNESAERIKQLTENRLTVKTIFEPEPETPESPEIFEPQEPHSTPETDAATLTPAPLTTPASVSPGGIDLSDTEELMEIKNILPDITPDPLQNLPYILPLFKGFDFQIINYKNSEDENLVYAK